MSLATPLSPRADQLAFLPHPRTPPNSLGFHAGPSSNNSSHQVHPESSPGRARSHTAPNGTRSPGGTAKSAPTSPLSRTQGHHGLAPLSAITPIQLDPSTSPTILPRAIPRVQKSPGRRQASLPVNMVQSKPLQMPLFSQQAQQYPNQAIIGYITGQQYSAPPHPRPQGQAIPVLSTPVTSYPSASASSSSFRPANRDGSVSRSRSRAKALSNSASSSSGTETEMDSDSTFVPGRTKNSKQSLSHPDLAALRSRLEGWAGGVAKGQAEERKAREARRRTPPSRPIPLTAHSMPTEIHGQLKHGISSKSVPALTALRDPPSPVAYTASIPPRTPVSSASDTSSSPSSVDRIPVGGMTGSEDADDDYEGTSNDSPSSGSLSFSPKRRKERLRNKLSMENKSRGLGLTLSPELSPHSGKKEDPIPVILERKLQQSSLLALRLLAIVPSMLGITVLLQAFFSGGVWVDVWPWGVDLSREALERLVAGGPWEVGSWKEISRGDMLLSTAWALCTAHFCFSLTTGLTHRWRSYYSLPSTLTRLLSLQCLCWPMTYLTLWVLGAKRPLLAWTVIGVTTGWSRTVQMWVTSNVVLGVSGENTPRAKPRTSILPPEGLNWWEEYTWDRKWDWDAIANEVGWKVGVLLLITTAWLFWGLETGRLVQV